MILNVCSLSIFVFALAPLRSTFAPPVYWSIYENNEDALLEIEHKFDDFSKEFWKGKDFYEGITDEEKKKIEEFNERVSKIKNEYKIEPSKLKGSVYMVPCFVLLLLFFPHLYNGLAYIAKRDSVIFISIALLKCCLIQFFAMWCTDSFCSYEGKFKVEENLPAGTTKGDEWFEYAEMKPVNVTYRNFSEILNASRPAEGSELD